MSSLTHRTIRAGSAYRSHGAGQSVQGQKVRQRLQTVVTLTPSPAVDRVYFFEDLVPGAVNRAFAVEEYLGGNGINVARTLTLAGNTTSAVIPVCHLDNSGLALVQGEGDLVRIVSVSAPIRVNTVLVSSGGSTTNANQKPGHLPEPEWRSVCEATLDQLRAMDADWLVVAGSLPQASDGHTVDLRWLLHQARELGAKVCLDINGPDLCRWANSNLVDLVKPNVPELEQFAGHPLRTVGDVVNAGRSLADAGIGTVLASMGGDGLIGLGPDGVLWARPPKTPVVNTTGAGDAALAGFLSETCLDPGGPTGAHNRRTSFAEALARSAGWGAVAVGRSTTALGGLTEVPDVIVQEPDPAYRLGNA
ncbi:1-phosphofructokinase family hexose kinase [Paenarthrobacter aromaticivorans]|uniref:1-phosphofructokinase family hexose kinase n=1 Tax=Paenarthrobacter aromaticivorans TaxID=2849150 RepID=UPI003A803D4D